MPVFTSSLPLMGSLAGGMGPWRDQDVVVPLLILVLGIAVGMCLAGLLVVLHYLRAGKVEAPRRGMERMGKPRIRNKGERGAGPGSWDGEFRWLAVRSARPRLVQNALGLDKATPCTWEEGLSAAHEDRLFISAPIGGWVLVLGSCLPELEDVDRCYRFIMELSRKVGHVEYFAMNRALNHHAWVQAEQGTILRAYAWAGRTVWNQGVKTRGESELGLVCFSYTDEPQRLLFGDGDPFAANTEKVSRLAARWSVDPTTLDPRLFRENYGIAGEVSRSGME